MPSPLPAIRDVADANFPARIATRVRSFRLIVRHLIRRTRTPNSAHANGGLVVPSGKMGKVTRPIDATFTPADTQWVSVSPKLTSARRVLWALLMLIPAVAGVALFFVPNIEVWIPILVLVATVVAFGWGFWYFARRTASWAYAEREDDLIVVHGFMFKRLVIVPYGRMQLVDLAAGPVDRAFGIATLQLHTAAATSDASIPGLVPEVAAALRDRLAHLGEQRAAGL